MHNCIFGCEVEMRFEFEIRFCIKKKILLSYRVHEKVRCTEIREGASFQKLFGPALSLGITSRRRVHHEAIKYEKEQNAGFLSSFGYSAISISAAVDAVSSIEVLVFTNKYLDKF